MLGKQWGFIVVIFFCKITPVVVIFHWVIILLLLCVFDIFIFSKYFHFRCHSIHLDRHWCKRHFKTKNKSATSIVSKSGLCPFLDWVVLNEYEPMCWFYFANILQMDAYRLFDMLRFYDRLNLVHSVYWTVGNGSDALWHEFDLLRNNWPYISVLFWEIFGPIFLYSFLSKRL